MKKRTIWSFAAMLYLICSLFVGVACADSDTIVREITAKAELVFDSVEFKEGLVGSKRYDMFVIDKYLTDCANNESREDIIYWKHTLNQAWDYTQQLNKEFDAAGEYRGCQTMYILDYYTGETIAKVNNSGDIVVEKIAYNRKQIHQIVNDNVAITDKDATAEIFYDTTDAYVIVSSPILGWLYNSTKDGISDIGEWEAVKNSFSNLYNIMIDAENQFGYNNLSPVLIFKFYDGPLLINFHGKWQYDALM